jgi:uncharacterized protein YndB with AHSA1/START domain
MNRRLDVNEEIEINVPADKVWDALTNSQSMKEFMLGAEISSDWKEGSPVTWKATVNGVNYEDKGTVLKIIPGDTLQYSHYSKLTGRRDLPENYHVITIKLLSGGGQTRVRVSDANNASEAELKHNEWGWRMILGYMKRFLEKDTLAVA